MTEYSFIGPTSDKISTINYPLPPSAQSSPFTLIIRMKPHEYNEITKPNHASIYKC